jgi:hypothetical protein
VFCLFSFVASGLVAVLVLEQVPHLEDEVAYLFQAQVFSTGRLFAKSPDLPECFFAPFVLDHEGRRFGKYPRLRSCWGIPGGPMQQVRR